MPPDYALKNDKPGFQCFTTDVGLLELVHIWGNTCAEHGRSGLRIFFHRTFAGVPLPDTDPNEVCLNCATRDSSSALNQSVLYYSSIRLYSRLLCLKCILQHHYGQPPGHSGERSAPGLLMSMPDNRTNS